MRKAQIMMEFVIALVIVIFVWGVAFYILAQKNAEVDYLKTKESAFVICNSIASSIDETWTMNKGTSILLVLPNQINFVDYTAQITSQKSVIISFSSNALICPFIADVTNGTSSNFTLSKGNSNFYNDGYKVVISSV